MNRQLYLSVVTVFVILCGCSQNPVETPNSSALGDSPTITGNISNLSDAGVGGTSLKVKAEIYSEPGPKVIAEGDVAANGNFSIKLPGIATLEDDLFVIDPTFDCVSDTLTVTPETFRGIGLLGLRSFILYSNNQRVEEVFYASETVDGGQNAVHYIFSDRDIKIQGPCDTGMGIYSFDVDMKKGWNTIIFGVFPDGERFGLRTAVPDSSYEWQIPRCIGCPN